MLLEYLGAGIKLVSPSDRIWQTNDLRVSAFNEASQSGNFIQQGFWTEGFLSPIVRIAAAGRDSLVEFQDAPEEPVGYIIPSLRRSRELDESLPYFRLGWWTRGDLNP